MDSNEKQPDIKLFIRHLTTKIKDIQTETFKNIKSCRGLNDELDKIKNFTRGLCCGFSKFYFGSVRVC
jgi:hypothetical protein